MDNITVDETQSNNIIETHSQVDSVSINSEPMLQFTGIQSSPQKVKKMRQRRQKLRRMNRMKAMKKNVKVETIEETDKDDDSSSTVKFLVKHTFNFLIAIITGFFNLMNNIINSPTGILWGILALLALCCTLGHASPVPANKCHRTNLPRKSVEFIRTQPFLHCVLGRDIGS